VLGDLGLWIPQVPVDYLMDHILPPIHCNFNTVKNKLEDSGCILGGRWAAFDKDPTKTVSNENNTFKAIEGVFTDIVHHSGHRVETEGDINSDNKGSGGSEGTSGDVEGSSGGAGEGTSGDVEGSDGGASEGTSRGSGDAGESKNRHAIRLLTFHNNPNQAPYSERHNDTRPDGYFVRPSTGVHAGPRGKSKAAVHNWDDIAVPAEFKKHDTPATVADVSFSLIDKS
jgi:hypothetical protein